MNGLELSFILNLGIRAAANYHMKLSGGSQGAAYTSVGIAFLNFLGIITYTHIYMQIKSKVQLYNMYISYSIRMKNAMESVRMNTIKAT